MKGSVESIFGFIRISNLFQKHLFRKYGQEVLTLHLLTITLRRLLNPPGFFIIIFKVSKCYQNVTRNMYLQYKSFVRLFLFVDLTRLRFFDIYEFEENYIIQTHLF